MPEATDSETVSVVIPCFNAAPFIRETLASVLAQTRKVDEIVVVDDGSTDHSASLAESFGPVVKVVRQANSGECASRNRGVAESTGSCIAFLDADDLWHPEKIERQLAYLRSNADAGAVMTSVGRFTDDVASYSPFLMVDDSSMRRLRPVDFLVHWWANQTAIMVRREFAAITPYPDGAAHSGDMIQSVELRSRTLIGAVPEILAFYRGHAGQVTQDPAHWLKSVQYRNAWGKQHYHRIGAATAEEVTVALLQKALYPLEALYRRRDLTRYRSARRELNELWPSSEPRPRELTRYTPPAAALRIRDQLAGVAKRLLKSVRPSGASVE